MSRPDIETLIERIRTGPSFEEAMSVLSLGHGHVFSAPPTDEHGVERLRILVSSLDGVATRAAAGLRRRAA